ncbi:MAG: DUF1365 domain-containing protein [Desulfobacterales bacterium]|nr:DUF1365 domain-containing protein [Desulfobacterales bacterium]
MYEGYVRHRRYVPKGHSLPLCDLFLAPRPCGDGDRFQIALAVVREGRECCPPRGAGTTSAILPCRSSTAVRDLVQPEDRHRAGGPHPRMMCHLRCAGHNFNPATFYYCYDAVDRHVETIIVEVHNTPWGEVFCYVLDGAQNVGTKAQKRFRLSKAFHLSPFIDMDVEYDWSFTEPGPALNVHMINMEKEEIFEADLAMTRREISPALAWRSCLSRYPFMTVKVVAGIYWRALPALDGRACPFTPSTRRVPGGEMT